MAVANSVLGALSDFESHLGRGFNWKTAYARIRLPSIVCTYPVIPFVL